MASLGYIELSRSIWPLMATLKEVARRRKDASEQAYWELGDSLLHGREDVEVAGGEKQAPDDEEALAYQDDVPDPGHESDGDVDGSRQEEVEGTEGGQGARSLEAGGDQLDLERDRGFHHCNG